MDRRTRIGLGVGAFLAVAIATIAAVRHDTLRATPTPEAAARPVDPTPTPVATARPSTPARAERAQDVWRAKRDRIRAAARKRRAEPAAPDPSSGEAPPPAKESCSEECWGTLELQLRLAGVIDGCRELLPEGAQGTARFDANVIAEPGLGAVVESVEVVDDAIGVDEFRDCIVESALLAELADPGDPVADRFRFRYRAGPRGDNAADFLTAHPDLVERYPQLAALRDRALDAPRSDEDATTFATVLTSDADALAAFERWTVEQGLDLSGVRAE